MYAGVQTSGVVYTTVRGQEVEEWRSEDLSKIAGEIMHITNLNRTKVRRQRVEVKEISKKGHGNQGSAFGRVRLTPENLT